MPGRSMPKRSREDRLWGWLVPHNPLCGGPAPLRGRTVIIGREGDVLLIATAGAYGAVMGSHYNLREPAPEFTL